MFSRKILVLGYYYRYNLGDDLFLETIPNFFKDSELTFKTTNDVYSLDLSKYDAIVFGGGDLINDFFLKTSKYARDNFSGPIIGFSLGIPYFETIAKGYLNDFDHVFVRNKSFLIPLQHALGSTYVHYLPDAVMSYGENLPYHWNIINNSNTIGTFFPSSIMKPKIMYKLCNALKKILDTNKYFKLHLFCFDTKENSQNNDIHINTEIEKFFRNYKDRVINDSVRYDGPQMIKNIANLKMAICSRFHSHILSILTGTPFVSLHYANKVGLLMKEKDLSEITCNISMNDQAKPEDFDESLFFKNFQYVIGNLEKVNQKLIKIRDHDKILIKDNYQVEKIIQTGYRRKTIPDPIFVDRVDPLFKKYKAIIENTTLLPLENSKDKLTCSESEKIAKSMIYEITGEISNECIYGTTENLITKPSHLRCMIDWIWKHKRNKVSKIPMVNLKTTCNQSFTGIHRSGWKFALDSIHSLHSEYGIIFDVYCDATFGWCRESPCKEFGIIPYTSPWCGFFHHTPYGGHSDNTIENSTSSLEFRQSLETCRGLFVMSEWLAEWLRKRLDNLGYPDIDVVTVYHPTSTYGIVPYKLPSIIDTIKIVNIGAWLRNAYSIYRLDLNPIFFKKYRLKGKSMDEYFPPEKIDFSLEIINTRHHDSSFLYFLYKYIRENNYLQKELKCNIDDSYYRSNLEHFINKQIESVTKLEYLPNEEFDLLMSRYIVFVDFIECSAANTIVECMARGNPIIVNRFPAVEEYLGKDYPLFYDDINDVEKILTIERITAAYNHMQQSIIKEKISSEKFYEDIINSSIIKNI